MNRFLGSRVHIHLGRSPINTKLHNRGKMTYMDDNGLVLTYGANQVSFFPWANVLRVDLLEEVEKDE